MKSRVLGILLMLGAFYWLFVHIIHQDGLFTLIKVAGSVFGILFLFAIGMALTMFGWPI